jgi:hypothetical protein
MCRSVLLRDYIGMSQQLHVYYAQSLIIKTTSSYQDQFTWKTSKRQKFRIIKILDGYQRLDFVQGNINH